MATVTNSFRASSQNFTNTDSEPPGSNAANPGPMSPALRRVQEIVGELHPIEAIWVKRFELLESHGYRLRPRFRPGWVAPWQGTNLNPYSFEDGLFHLVCLSIVCLPTTLLLTSKLPRLNPQLMPSEYETGQLS